MKDGSMGTETEPLGTGEETTGRPQSFRTLVRGERPEDMGQHSPLRRMHSWKIYIPRSKNLITRICKNTSNK